jgi:hypothetical protein
MKSILFLILLIPMLAFPQIEGKGNKWDYPVKPGADAWKSLKNNAEKVQVCQIPGDVLATMNTKTLLNVCLDYPLLPDIFAFNNIKDGFGKFENDFNGFRELIKRDDAPKELLGLYKTLDPMSIPGEGSILEKGAYVFGFSFIELFISYPSVIEKYSTKEKKEIVGELLLKKEKKKSRPDWYQNIGMQTNDLAIVRMIQSDQGKFRSGLDSTQIYPYIYSGILTSPEIIDQIEQEAIQYVKSN